MRPSHLNAGGGSGRKRGLLAVGLVSSQGRHVGVAVQAVPVVLT
jgi:hypothetical protein